MKPKAGKKHLLDHANATGWAAHPHPDYVDDCWLCADIDAIEAEAITAERARLDEDRLARALQPYEMELGPNDGFPAVITALDAHEFAAAIAKAYREDCDHSECIEKIEELSDQIARQAASDKGLIGAFDSVRTIATERARIRAEVEKLDWTNTGEVRWGDDITLREVLAIIDGKKIETEPGYNCDICGRYIIKEAQGGSAGDHDSGLHVINAYGSKYNDI